MQCAGVKTHHIYNKRLVDGYSAAFFFILSMCFFSLASALCSLFQPLAWLWLRKPHSRLAEALAVVLTSKVQGKREGKQQRSRDTGQQTLAPVVKGVRGTTQYKAELEMWRMKGHRNSRAAGTERLLK